MTDPRDFDRRMDMERQAEMEMDRRMRRVIGPWGLVAAAVVIVVVLALLFSWR